MKTLKTYFRGRKDNYITYEIWTGDINDYSLAELYCDKAVSFYRIGKIDFDCANERNIKDYMKKIIEAINNIEK